MDVQLSFLIKCIIGNVGKVIIIGNVGKVIGIMGSVGNIITIIVGVGKVIIIIGKLYVGKVISIIGNVGKVIIIIIIVIIIIGCFVDRKQIWSWLKRHIEQLWWRGNGWCDKGIWLLTGKGNFVFSLSPFAVNND